MNMMKSAELSLANGERVPQLRVNSQELIYVCGLWHFVECSKLCQE
jgi:hypothetical protein